jgi:hypothetical protein
VNRPFCKAAHNEADRNANLLFFIVSALGKRRTNLTGRKKSGAGQWLLAISDIRCFAAREQVMGKPSPEFAALAANGVVVRVHDLALLAFL